MSLVDYASSSDDDVSEPEAEQQHDNVQPQISKQQPSPPPPRPNLRSESSSSSNNEPEIAATLSLPPPFESFEKLPDASMLLNSTTISLVSGNDHASRVAAAMAESATRKRDANGLSSTLPRRKIPKGTLPHSKNVLDTAGGSLLPPQLSGRSNIVTEDISKLFVRRQEEPSSQ
ncbi:uncharacterized protein LOC123214167 [Mangifera indica]|uniref:uncharacterized protein LOC123214167 n=1 Tax=Mangifera indica TaxID=29780 RepID=UPI001CFB82E2|nr:uncharacterized protein LOC123214167 [Mangifera indica]XP_044489857.1 uncharacterized protein LOC123214167 [Mangifera indica]